MATEIQILLVEDSDYDIAIMKARFRTDHRFNLVSVATLKDAIAKLQEVAIDVILTDLNLPDSSGFSTFTQLHTACPEVPIVILTGDDDITKAIEAIRLGAEDYVPKTEGDIKVLVRALLYAFERNARRLRQQ